MEFIKRNRWAQFAVVLFLLLALLAAQQFIELRIAHSSFANYAAFRGCEHITSQTATDGTCTLPSGEPIKMVLYHGKWYLDGDLPPLCFDNICL